MFCAMQEIAYQVDTPAALPLHLALPIPWPRNKRKVPCPGFDQEAAAVLMARYAVFKCENEALLPAACDTCPGGPIARGYHPFGLSS